MNNDHGITLIQITIAMGLVSVGLLIALQVMKFQTSTTRRLSNDHEKTSSSAIGIKEIKKNLHNASHLSVSSTEKVEFKRSKMNGDQIVTQDFSYSLTNECHQDYKCLTLKTKVGNTETVIKKYALINNIKFCHRDTSSLCTEFDNLIPDRTDANNNRLIIQTTIKDLNTKSPLIIINLKNNLDTNELRDDFHFIEG